MSPRSCAPWAAITVTCLTLLGCQNAAQSPAQAGGGPAPAAITSPSNATPGPALDAEERHMLALVNQHRAANGLSALRLQPALTRSSAWLSHDMAARDDLSHTDSLGRDPFQRMDAFGFEQESWRGENIACGNGSAEETYEQWLYSPGHNANMLGEHYTLIGIARAYNAGSKYGWFWTTDFGSD